MVVGIQRGCLILSEQICMRVGLSVFTAILDVDEVIVWGSFEVLFSLVGSGEIFKLGT